MKKENPPDDGVDKKDKKIIIDVDDSDENADWIKKVRDGR